MNPVQELLAVLRTTALISIFTCQVCTGTDPEQLPDSEPLRMQGDIAAHMLDRLHHFLDAKIAQMPQQRDRWWFGESAGTQMTVEDRQRAIRERIPPARAMLKKCVGLRDQRVEATDFRLLATTARSATVASGNDGRVLAVQWPVLDAVQAEGLLIVPPNESPNESPAFAAIVVPDAQQTPEQLAGVTGGLEPRWQWARALAQRGGIVAVPSVISRTLTWRGTPENSKRVELTNREFVYRPAFELGRHPLGYEIHDVLACVDIFKSKYSDVPVYVAGQGEGGLVALMAGALDDRIDGIACWGCWGPREGMWKEPIDRNLFSFLPVFGCAELGAMIAPRALLIGGPPYPQATFRGGRGAPGRLAAPRAADYLQELRRLARSCKPSDSARQLLEPHNQSDSSGQTGDRLSYPTVTVVRGELLVDPTTEALTSPLANFVRGVTEDATESGGAWQVHWLPDAKQREERRIEQLRKFHERALADAARVRNQFFAKLDTSSLKKFEETIQPYREYFRSEVIGHFDIPLLPPGPRTRVSWRTEKWTGHEVVLQVWPDVIAYGVLLLPNGLAAERRYPVVVCQHGLEGRPTDTFLGDHRAYHDYAARLCEKGYVVFAPQNIYLFGDKFRTLQRKLNPIGKTLFSVMVAQHQQIVDWLQSLPFVDPGRIGFYGLSYGGKSAMRIPALVEDYALSICSADFNEWIVKNASTREPFSYVWTGEYEMFEFDLGNTFNYAEMAALICPRPFMVERGHFDGVGHDHWVAFEYAKVRHLYQARLGIGDRTEIEWFVGPHTIHGVGTFRFLDRFLKQGIVAAP